MKASTEITDQFSDHLPAQTIKDAWTIAEQFVELRPKTLSGT